MPEVNSTLLLSGASEVILCWSRWGWGFLSSWWKPPRGRIWC